MTIDLCEDKRKRGNSYVELLINYLSILNIRNKNDKLCGVWCIIARLNPVKVIACRKTYENCFKTIITSGVKLETGILVKDITELKKTN